MKNRGYPDMAILFSALILLGIGLVMVFSASAVKSMVLYGDRFYYLKRQLAWAAISIAAMLFAMNFDYRHLKRLAPLILLGGLGLLVVVLIPGIGRVAHGARRWIGVGSLGVQPSEVMKLAFVIFLAASMSAKGKKMRAFTTGVIPYVALCGVVFALILKQPDLGTAVAIASTAGIMLFAAGVRISHLLLLAISAVPVLYWAVTSEEYRLRRFLAFLDPWSDLQDTGYHIVQSLYALGSGGPFGVGLGWSRQKFFYLPEQHTDFIFAILGEEFGFLGTSTLILLFFFFAWRGYRVALNAPDAFGSLLACGITTMIALQAVINIAVVTATIPITGIPLPFLSSGGSSLLFTMTGVGILLNISRYTTE